MIRASRVIGGQTRIIPANLRGGAFRMVQKVEVVHHHQLRGACCGDQQWMQALHDVEGVASQTLDRGPFPPVPGPIQQGNGNSMVRRFRARQDPRSESILPGGGEQSERLADGRRSEKRTRDFVDIFADPGSLPEGGPVVDQDPHERNPPDAITQRSLRRSSGRNSLAVNGLTGFDARASLGSFFRQGGSVIT